jgi:dihydrofolate reductase
LSGGPVRVALVVAAGENGVIGNGGKLPWRLPGDLRQFRRLTLGKPVVMGRRTFQSIGKPLDGRDNIVVTRDRSFHPSGVLVAHTVPEALEQACQLARQRGVDEVCIIGGAEIYQATLDDADRVYLTRVLASPEGDTYFPPLDPQVWRQAAQQHIERHPQDEHDAVLIVFDRVA